MLEILNYDFFQYALLGGILISFISGILGVFVIMRRESNITHSISNFLFLGISTSLFFTGNYYFFAFIFGILGSLLIYLLEKSNFITKESSKEIISQTGLASGLFLIGFLDNLTLDINNLLFGSILLINIVDIIIIFILLIILIILFYFFGKNFLAVIINEDISKSIGIKTNLYNLFFLIFLSIFIGITIKIFGILLIGAFLVIPANIGKILGNNIKQTFIISISSSLIGVIIGLFSSYFLGTSTGSTIVLILIICFILSIFCKIRK